MKKVLSLLAGIAFVLAFGMAYADDAMPGSKDTGDKMIRDEDLQKYNKDQSQSTVNQMPAKPDAEGSAAGGSENPGSTPKDDTYEKPAPAEKDTTKPADTGPGMKDPSQEKNDQDTYR